MTRPALARLTFLAGFSTLARLTALARFSTLARPAAAGAAALPGPAAALAAVAVTPAALFAQGLFQVGTFGVEFADNLVWTPHVELVFHDIAVHHLKVALVGKAHQHRLVILLPTLCVDLST